MTESQQDRDLFDAWKGGDAAARGKLIVRMTGIARKVANRYSSNPDTREDLLSEAMVGVCEAVDRWDGDGDLVGFAFTSAKWRACKFLRASIPFRDNTVSIYAYSATEQIEEWRSFGDQEEQALVSEIRSIARSVLPPTELEVVMTRLRGFSGEELARQCGLNARARVTEHETSAMTRLTTAVNERS